MLLAKFTMVVCKTCVFKASLHFDVFRYQSSQKLVSHDTHSNTYNYKTSYAVEMPPVCKVIKIALKLPRYTLKN